VTRSSALGHRSSITLGAGNINYWSQGSGPPVVFVHGVLANADLWREVAPAIAAAGYTCLAPDWPLGSHERPMGTDAALDPHGIALLIGEFLDALDLNDVTLVANDTGGAITLLLVAEDPVRVARLVLTSSDCFEYFFPKVFWPLQAIPRIFGGVGFLAFAMRLRLLHRLPMAFGWLSKRPMDQAITESFLGPTRRNVKMRRDLRKFLLGVDNRLTLDVVPKLRSFRKPVLLAWSREDKLFPFSLAERLATVFPNATVRPIDDAFTFSPLDQPDQLVAVVTDFLRTNRPA
jgi:pimeloyl-ACP methyl ester carboxylesterase